MEFSDPLTATNSDQCARLFCATIHRLLTFAIKNIADAQCVEILDGMRSKYRLACDTIMTQEQIVEQVGEVLLHWKEPICNYDANFFMRTDLASLIADARDVKPDVSTISQSIRERFYRATTKEIHVVILDALNFLLILYARYCAFCARSLAQ